MYMLMLIGRNREVTSITIHIIGYSVYYTNTFVAAFNQLMERNTVERLTKVVNIKAALSPLSCRLQIPMLSPVPIEYTNHDSDSPADATNRSP